MEKIRFLFRQLDGVTPVDQAPDFQLVRGWTQATVQGPAGILPGSLFGKVPGGDPYLLHVAVSTTLQLAPTDLVELQSGPPVQPRRQYQPTPGNTILLLVRPTDRLRFVIAPQPEIAVELLVESIGGVNELGSRLFGWAEASQGRQNSSAARRRCSSWSTRCRNTCCTTMTAPTACARSRRPSAPACTARCG